MTEVVVLNVGGSLPEDLEVHRLALLERLAEIDRRARQEAEPYVKALARIEMHRPVRYMVLPK